MIRALWLARTVVGDAIEDRAPHTAGLVAIAMIAAGPLVAHLSMGASTRAQVDLGLWLQWIVALGVAMNVGVAAVGRPLRDRTAALEMVRPLSPTVWVAGRMLGVWTVSALYLVILACLWVAVSAWRGLPIGSLLLWFYASTWAECTVVATLAGALSSRLSALSTFACTAAIWAAGHTAPAYAQVMQEHQLAWVADVMFFAIPDLHLLSVHAAVVHQTPVDPVGALGALCYALCWTTALTALTVWSISRRDIA